MAKLSRWAIFLRAFLLTLVVGQTERAGAQSQAEAEAWRVASSVDSPAGYYRYLSQYPSGAYVEQAIAGLIRLGAMNQAAPGRQIPPLGRRGGGSDDGPAVGAGGSSGGGSRADSRDASGAGSGSGSQGSGSSGSGSSGSGSSGPGSSGSGSSGSGSSGSGSSGSDPY